MENIVQSIRIELTDSQLCITLSGTEFLDTMTDKPSDNMHGGQPHQQQKEITTACTKQNQWVCQPHYLENQHTCQEQPSYPCHLTTLSLLLS